MSTLIENVAKVEAANTAIGNAISSFGVTVQEGSRLSEKPALIGKIPRPGPSGWGRPANWPRIDLIPMKGLDHDVCYFIIRKPEDEVNHGFMMRGTSLAKADGQQAAPTAWYMTQIDVSADGQTVTEIESTKQTAGQNATIGFQFPASDPVGTVYAVKIATDVPGHFGLIFASPLNLNNTLYNSGVVVREAIVRTQKNLAPSWASGGYQYSAPAHIVYSGCAKGISGYEFKAMIGVEYVELRDGTRLDIGLVKPSWDYNTVCDVDDDVTFSVDMASAKTFLTTVFKQDSNGEIPWIDKLVSSSSGEKLDWNLETRNLSNLFLGNFSVMRLSLPAGFGKNSKVISTLFALRSLESISIPDGFGSEATTLSNVFQHCSSLATISLPDGCGAKATNMTGMFSYCYYLRDLHLPAGFAQVATVAKDIFVMCGLLTNITGNPNFKVSISLANSPHLTHDSLMVVINGLQTVTTAQTLTLGAANLAKLTDEEKKVATDKGWTLA